MRQFLLGLGASAVFVAGCVAGASNFAVPRAKAADAGASEHRWAYFCFDAESTEDIHTKANAAGARGWEMVAGVAHSVGERGGSTTWCFRQPRP